ncbi:MAG: methylenetetrahydrofolate reductase [Candidatus Margulisiibacteriota bacterium]
MHLVELVPREMETFIAEAQALMSAGLGLFGINVPDVLRLSNRSHDAATALLRVGIPAIPHIRAIDRPLDETLSLVDAFVKAGGAHVLIVSGDIPDGLRQTYPVHPVDIVAALKARFDLKVYCAIDPYRTSFAKELAYIDQKRQAGADGFFTQPFFDAGLAKLYLDQLEGTSVFLGISPVMSEKSKNYWITKNHAVFPKDFSLDFEANVAVAKNLVDVAVQNGQHTYSMPILCPALAFSKAVFT